MSLLNGTKKCYVHLPPLHLKISIFRQENSVCLALDALQMDFCWVNHSINTEKPRFTLVLATLYLNRYGKWEEWTSWNWKSIHNTSRKWSKVKSMRTTVKLMKFMALSERGMPLWTITVLGKFLRGQWLSFCLIFPKFCLGHSHKTIPEDQRRSRPISLILSILCIGLLWLFNKISSLLLTNAGIAVHFSN